MASPFITSLYLHEQLLLYLLTLTLTRVTAMAVYIDGTGKRVSRFTV